MTRIFKTMQAFAGMVLLVLAGEGAWGQPVWAHTWFYCLAWWGALLCLDGWLGMRPGQARVFESWRQTGWLLWGSMVFWFFWEAVNLRLGNWTYHEVPPQWWQRWGGYFLAYATVLPAEILWLRLIILWWPLAGEDGPGREWPGWRHWSVALALVGAGMFLAALVWPGWFFPLVWLGPILVMDWLLRRAVGWSLLGRGRGWALISRMLVAGFACGLCWEGLNWLAGARWSYSLPYLNTPRIFAMPVAGYLGFAGFAVECWLFMACLGHWVGIDLMGGEPGMGYAPRPKSHHMRHLAVAVAGVVMGLVVSGLIDLFTIEG